MLVMHIGSPKTGTTSLQGFLHGNEDALRARGINYMRAGRAHIAHNPLPQAIARREDADMLAAIAREYAAAPESVHVISSEIMFRIVVARRLHDTCPAELRNQVRIVCYLRRQDHYAEAIYKQFAKNGLVRLDRAAFLEDQMPKLFYSGILDTYARIFGRDNIVVRPFERSLLRGGDIVEDFATDHLRLPTLNGLERQNASANPSLSVELTEMLGRIAHDRNANSRDLIRELGAMDDPLLFASRDTFSRAARAQIMARVAEDNARIRALYLPQAERLFDLSDLDGGTDDPALSPEQVAARSHAGALALARAMQTLASRAIEDARGAAAAPAPAPVQTAPEPIPEPPPAAASYPLWFSEIMPTGPRTGYFRWLGHHGVTYVDRGTRQLVVTFDNLHNVGDSRPERDPWAAKFCAEQSWSHLGVISQRPDWLRDPELIRWFDEQADSGFFKGFDRVAFAGASMGGFGALSFSGLSPGADVIAFSPQSTLDANLVPWEERFAKGRAADWSLPGSDAAETILGARRVWLIHDPFNRPDSLHAARLSSPNVTTLRAPGVGHKSALAINRMGLLKPLMRAAIEGTLDPGTFFTAIRKRRELFIYREEMAGYLTAKGQETRATRLRTLFKQNRRRARTAQ